MKKLALSVLGLIVVFIVVLIVNTMMFSTRQVNVDPDVKITAHTAGRMPSPVASV